MTGIESGALYALKAALVFAVVMAIVRRGLAAHHPFPRFGPANQVTTIRALLAALASALIGEAATPGIAWCVVGAAALVGALDGIDGWLARRSGMASDFGARFDMETDAFFILVLSMLAWHHGKAGAWVILCGLIRYAFVAAGWILPWMARPLRSTTRGKAVAVGQMAGLALALAPPVRPPLSAVVCAVTLGTLVWSFAIDVLWLWRRYRT
jgi:phosphatidylglycerophosphate synthase